MKHIKFALIFGALVGLILFTIVRQHNKNNAEAEKLILRYRVIGDTSSLIPRMLEGFLDMEKLVEDTINPKLTISVYNDTDNSVFRDTNQRLFMSDNHLDSKDETFVLYLEKSRVKDSLFLINTFAHTLEDMHDHKRTKEINKGRSNHLYEKYETE